MGKVFHNLHILWMCTCMSPNYDPFLFAKLLEVAYKSGFTSWGASHLCSEVVEIVDPIKWAPTSLWNMFQVFHNIYMLQMCTCRYLSHVTAAVVGQACIKYLQQQIWSSPKGQTTAMCVFWGCRPYIKWALMSPVKSISQYLYAVNVQCRCHHHVTSALVGQAFWNLPTNVWLPPEGQTTV